MSTDTIEISLRGDDARADGTPEGLATIEELFRQLIIAEKNVHLYPLEGKVVQQSIDTVEKLLDEAFEEIGPFRVRINQSQITYGDVPVYEEEHKGKSVAFRLYKDGIRELLLLPGCKRAEIQEFLKCLEQARNLEDEDDDFITLFWEKDCTHVQLHLADDFISSEDLPQLPAGLEALYGLEDERFEIPEGERQRLEAVLEARKADDSENHGESTFELTEDEQAQIRDLVRDEDDYFPVFDFLNILIELMARQGEEDALERSIKIMRTVLDSLVQERDFEHAAELAESFVHGSHPGLKDRQKLQLREMVESFQDRKTIETLKTYLEANPTLSDEHAVFRFMSVFPKSAAEDFCEFLPIPSHLESVSKVLVRLGSGNSRIYEKFLTHPDPEVVRAVMTVLLETDGVAGMKRVATALKHPDENIRILAAKTLIEHGSVEIGRHFLPLLQESSPQLLNLALQFFTKCAVPEAWANLRDLCTGSRLLRLDQKRQEQAFRALLTTCPEEALKLVEKKILAWPFAFTQSAKDRKSAALRGLSWAESEHAMTILARFATRGRGFLAKVASKALADADTRLRNAAAASKEHGKKKLEVMSV